MTHWTLPEDQPAELVPMTNALVDRFYGQVIAPTMRGFAVCVAGEPMVLLGVRQEPYRWVLFSDAKEEARGEGNFHTRRMVVRGLHALMGLIDRLHAPVDAVTDSGFQGAEEILLRLGFVPLAQGVYRWQALKPTSRLH